MKLDYAIDEILSRMRYEAEEYTKGDHDLSGYSREKNTLSEKLI